MKSFIIASLAIAGFSSSKQSADLQKGDSKNLERAPNFQNLLNRTLPFTLVGHSSHRSHGSHRSHRSSSRAVPNYSKPAPSTPPPKPSAPSTNRNQNSTPPSAILPNSPAINLPKIKGNSAHFKRIVMRVQMMLYALGHYTGELDGLAGTDTRTAIAKYQQVNGLPITGQIDEELLKRMNVAVD